MDNRVKLKIAIVGMALMSTCGLLIAGAFGFGMAQVTATPTVPVSVTLTFNGAPGPASSYIVYKTYTACTGTLVRVGVIPVLPDNPDGSPASYSLVDRSIKPGTSMCYVVMPDTQMFEVDVPATIDGPVSVGTENVDLPDKATAVIQ